MSDESSEAMSNEDFKQCLDALHRAAESSRSVFFAYVVIYGALLVWALNAIIYPAEQQRIGQVRDKQVETINCLVKLETLKADATDLKTIRENEDIKKCYSDLKDTSLSIFFGQDSTIFTATGAKLDFLRIDTDYIQHEINYQLDKSHELSRFNIPLIGVASDRTWLWLISMVLGPLLYYIIRDSLANLNYLLGYLYDRSLGPSRSTRLALLSVAQVVSASTQRTRTKTGDEPKGRGSFTKISMISMVLTLPIVLSILIIYDWYYFVFLPDAMQINCPGPNAADSSFTVHYLCSLGIIQKYKTFFEEPEFWGGILTIPVVAFEAVLFCQIYRLLTNLSTMHQKVRYS
jgi:hypothetical protein